MFRRLTAFAIMLSLVFVAVIPFTLTAFAAPAGQKNGEEKQARKLAPEFDSSPSDPNETIRVVIQTKGHLTAAHDQAIEARHGHKRQALDALDTLIADVPRSEVASLAARDDVAYVSSDRAVRAQMDVTREATGANLAQSESKGPGKAAGVTGKGVTIAVIDSGISARHPDFQKENKSRIVAAVNFTTTGSGTNANGTLLGDGVVLGDGDRYGHGTGVAGAAAGNGAASKGYAANYSGIAPEANLVDLKVLDGNGVGTTSATLNAID